MAVTALRLASPLGSHHHLVAYSLDKTVLKRPKLIWVFFLSGLQKIRYEQGDFRGVFEMERYKFEQLHEWQRLNLKFLD